MGGPYRCQGCGGFSCKCHKINPRQMSFDFSDLAASRESARLHLAAINAATDELAQANGKLYQARILLRSLDKVLND